MQRFQPVVITRSYRLLNIQLQRSGFYSFLYKNIINLILTVGILLILFILLNKYIVDFKDFIETGIGSINSYLVFGSYYVSQSFFGFLPTNIFVIWIDTFKHPAAMLLVLSLLSYAGGITSYLIGFYAGNNKIIRRVVDGHKLNIPEKANKWGGLLVMISAIFPLPFSLVCVSSGIVRLPIQNFMFWSLARIPKFFLLAWLMHLVL